MTLRKSAKIAAVYIRSAPIMEILTGVMIAILIFYSGKLIINGEIGINNFFILAAMMLAYQPVKTLTKVNLAISQGFAAAERILPIIDNQNEISLNEQGDKLNIVEGDIVLDKINFAYKSNPENKVLQDMSLKFTVKMTALVGHSGSGNQHY